MTSRQIKTLANPADIEQLIKPFGVTVTDNDVYVFYVNGALTKPGTGADHDVFRIARNIILWEFG